MNYLYLFFFFLCFSFDNGPWGKDADLIQPKKSCNPQGSDSVIEKLGETMIRFHQDVISPCDGPRSHYLPSSSQYTLDAMHKYGFCRGFLLGCDRLMRENSDPWIYPQTFDPAGSPRKWDPVK